MHRIAVALLIASVGAVALRWGVFVGAAFLAVPLFGMLLVGATFVAGSRYGPRVGVAAALLTAASPIFLYQLVQPTSDVPAAALWMLAVAAATGTRRSGAALAGVAAAIAVVVRPNLAPLAIPLVLFLLLRPERMWHSRAVAAGTFAACAAFGVVAVALIQIALYGSPMASGYGPLSTLLGTEHIPANAAQHFSWLTGAQTPAWLLAGAAPLLLPGALTGVMAALIAVNVACYLPYIVFDDWSYLRFLLPVIPLVMILTVASVDAICRRLAPWTARPVIALVALGLAVLGLRSSV